MFGRRGTSVQERPVQEQRTPVQDVPPEGPGPADAGNVSRNPLQMPERPVSTTRVYERPGMLSQEETIHSSSLSRTLMGRLMEYTGMALVLAEITLLLRLSFSLDNVSVTSGFVSWIFTTSAWLVKPFQGIFDNHIIRGGGTFEPANLIAIAVYLVGGLIIMALIGLLVSGMRRARRAI